VVRDRRVLRHKDWLPPVGICIEDGKTPPPAHSSQGRQGLGCREGDRAQRTPTTATPTPSYRSPLPVTTTHRRSSHGQGRGRSVITWTGTYTPDAGKEKDASEALNGVYEAGLASDQGQFTK